MVGTKFTKITQEAKSHLLVEAKNENSTILV
jgi:hypothetical protein